MKNLIAILLAAMFAAVSFQAVAQEKKAPTKADCDKNPTMKGCEAMKK
jgi:hypothetical protein